MLFQDRRETTQSPFGGHGYQRRRGAELALEIYERVSGSGSLIPPAVGFIFDSDGRSEQDKQDLQRRAKGRMHFLSRRMFENYLLNPVAIAAVAVNDVAFSGAE